MDVDIENLYRNYIDHAFAYVNKTKLPNPYTGIPNPPNETFLEDVEKFAGVMPFAYEDFRQQVCLWVAMRGGQPHDSTYQPMLRRGLERKMAHDTRPTMLELLLRSCRQPKPTVGTPVDLNDLKAELGEGLTDITPPKFTSEGGFSHDS